MVREILKNLLKKPKATNYFSEGVSFGRIVSLFVFWKKAWPDKIPECILIRTTDAAFGSDSINNKKATFSVVELVAFLI